MHRGARSPGHHQPNSVVPRVLSAGFKLEEAEPFPSIRAWGFAWGGCRCGTAASQPQVGGFPRALREGGHCCFHQGALPVSPLPRRLRTTLLALISSQLSFSASVIAVIFVHAEHHHTAPHHHSRRLGREEVRDVPPCCARAQGSRSSANSTARLFTVVMPQDVLSEVPLQVTSAAMSLCQVTPCRCLRSPEAWLTKAAWQSFHQADTPSFDDFAPGVRAARIKAEPHLISWLCSCLLPAWSASCGVFAVVPPHHVAVDLRCQFWGRMPQVRSLG